MVVNGVTPIWQMVTKWCSPGLRTGPVLFSICIDLGKRPTYTFSQFVDGTKFSQSVDLLKGQEGSAEGSLQAGLMN